jgi:hypothetical protein
MLSDSGSSVSENPQQKQVARPKLPYVPDEEIEYDDAGSSDQMPKKINLMPEFESIDIQAIVDTLYNLKPSRSRCCTKQQVFNALKTAAVFVGGLTPPTASLIKDVAGLPPPTSDDKKVGISTWIEKFPVLSPFFMHSSGLVIHSVLSENAYAALVQTKKDIEAIRGSIFSTDMTEEQVKLANALYGSQDARKDKVKSIKLPPLPSRRRWANHGLSIVLFLATIFTQFFSGANEVSSLTQDNNVDYAGGRIIKDIANLGITLTILLLLTGIGVNIVEWILSKAIESFKSLSEIKKNFVKTLVDAQKIRFTLLLEQVKKHEKHTLEQLRSAQATTEELQTQNEEQQFNISNLSEKYKSSKLQTVSKQGEVDNLYAKQIKHKKAEQALHHQLTEKNGQIKDLSTELEKQQSKFLDLTKMLDQSKFQTASKQEQIDGLRANLIKQNKLEQILRQKLVIKKNKIKVLLTGRETNKQFQLNKKQKGSSKTDLFQQKSKEPSKTEQLDDSDDNVLLN